MHIVKKKKKKKKHDAVGEIYQTIGEGYEA